MDRLASKMGLDNHCVRLYCDSQSALHLIINNIMDSRVKHIDVRYYFVKEIVCKEKIELLKIEGKLNPVNIFTKMLPFEAFIKHRTRINLLH